MASALLVASLIALLTASGLLWRDGYARRRVMAPLLSGRRHREHRTWFYRAPRWTFPLAVLAWIVSANVAGALVGPRSSGHFTVRHVQAMVAANLLFAVCIALIRLIGALTRNPAQPPSHRTPNSPNPQDATEPRLRWSSDPFGWALEVGRAGGDQD
ncbi:MAG: hypothetical protein D6725_17210, partial [Planctomycetota bacterium]